MQTPIGKSATQLGKENLQFSEEIIVFEAPIPLKAISAGVTGAGIGYYKRFVNRHVDKDYNPKDYHEEMIRFLTRKAFHPDETVSMMTAVKLKDVVYEKYIGENFSIFIVVTAGTGNAVDATLGKEHLKIWNPGTINTWIFVNGKLTDAAFIQAIITTTEAKVKALEKRNITDEVTGTIATGTSTDSILIAATQSGKELEFAGPISELGALIGEGVYACIIKALKKTRIKK
ncbi:adenosylcobinamide amidohydrolase [Oceanobacillus sp. CAU 1775]